MKKILLLFVSLAALSCGQNNNETVSDVTVIKVPLSSSENTVNISDITDSIHYIKLQTSPECLIGVIDKIIPTKDGIIVVDEEKARSVFLFAKDGTFIRKIGKVGAGPEEVSALTSVFVDQKSERVFISDHIQKKILTFSFDGAFLEGYPLATFIYDAEYLGEDKIACFMGYRKNAELERDNKNPNILIYNLKESKIEGKYSYHNKDLTSGYLVGSFNNLNSLSDGTASYYVSICDTVFSVNKNSVQAKYAFDFGTDNPKALKDYVQDLIDTKPHIKEVSGKYMSTQAVLLEGYAETAATAFFMYKKANAFYMSLYDKASGNVIEGMRKDRRMSIKDDVDNMLFFFPMAADENYFYMQADPAMLMSLTGDKLNDRTRHLQSISTDNDNPIIAAVKIKRF